MGFEPTTFSLARRRSTTELRPQTARLAHLAESAETQDRTGDTAIFSRVLYQLSYLGRYLFVKRVGFYTHLYGLSSNAPPVSPAPPPALLFRKFLLD